MAAIAPPQPIYSPRETAAPPSSPPPPLPTDISAPSQPPPPPPPQGLGKRTSVTSIRRKSVPSAEPGSPSTIRSFGTAGYNERIQAKNELDMLSPTSTGSWPARIPGSSMQYQEQLPHFESRVTSMASTAATDLELSLEPTTTDDPRIQEPLASPVSHPRHVINGAPIPQPQQGIISSGESNRSSASSFAGHGSQTPPTDMRAQEKRAKLYPQLQYHHQQQYAQSPDSSSLSVSDPNAGTPYSRNSSSPASSEGHGVQARHLDPQAAAMRGLRPMSSYSTLSVDTQRRTGSASPGGRRALSTNYDLKRGSFMDLTAPAHTQHAPAVQNDNGLLQASIGNNLSLLSQKQTLEMYRKNSRKTGDPLVQYEFAVYLVALAQQQLSSPPASGRPSRSSDSRHSPSPAPGDEQPSRKELLKEAQSILDRIKQTSPQAQYYLADGYASGIFNKDVPDNDRAFPLFVAASKHGHAEAGYRAALCYEFGWGCKRDPAKAVQFYRAAASKNHPGAMTRLGLACMRGDLGLVNKHREGVKWLKRATDIADEQYPSAPYELGALHETGFGEDVFEDPSYAAQLYTQAAALGHAEAHFKMGEAYEYGKLNCPRDAALSVHFYTGAAQKGHAGAMMALCAWYLVGAEPVLERNEEEAYIWACKASELGLPKAEYARGYFTEMGIGCRRDPLEANVWYVRAAQHNDERAIARLKVINEAASNGNGNAASGGKGKNKEGKLNGGDSGRRGSNGGQKVLTKEKGGEGKGEGGEKGDCVVM